MLLLATAHLRLALLRRSRLLRSPALPLLSLLWNLLLSLLRSLLRLLLRRLRRLLGLPRFLLGRLGTGIRSRLINRQMLDI